MSSEPNRTARSHRLAHWFVCGLVFSCLATQGGDAPALAHEPPAGEHESAATPIARESTDRSDKGACSSCLRHRRPTSHELWLVSTRSLGCAREQELAAPELEFLRHDAADGWRPSTSDAFLARQDPPVTTCIYIHGNRTDAADAIDEAMDVYRALVRDGPDEPLRFVIWSWPSDWMFGLLRDVRAKAKRTDVDGYYLAWLLARVEDDAPVSLIGYSYGARIAMGAAHMLAGGELDGMSLGVQTRRGPRRMRMVLLAASMHNDWLLPGQLHERAMSRVDRMLLSCNACDPVLKRYRFLSRGSRRDALGATGLVWPEQLGVAVDRVRQLDASWQIGKSHRLSSYLGWDLLVDEMRRYCLWRAIDEPSPRIGDARASRASGAE